MEISNNIKSFNFNFINLTEENKFIKFIYQNKKITTIVVGIFIFLALIFAFYYQNKKAQPEILKQVASSPKQISIKEMFDMQIEMNKQTQLVEKEADALKQQQQDLMQTIKTI